MLEIKVAKDGFEVLCKYKSHKIGMKKSENQFHDCGIVYYKEEAYIICVMTKNLDYDKSNKVISDISRITFSYFSKDN